MQVEHINYRHREASSDSKEEPLFQPHTYSHRPVYLGECIPSIHKASTSADPRVPCTLSNMLSFPRYHPMGIAYHPCSNLSLRVPTRSEMGTLIWAMVSRSRMVTCLSSRVWKSTVTQ